MKINKERTNQDGQPERMLSGLVPDNVRGRRQLRGHLPTAGLHKIAQCGKLGLFSQVDLRLTPLRRSLQIIQGT
jgi:hypothetical protein